MVKGERSRPLSTLRSVQVPLVPKVKKMLFTLVWGRVQRLPVANTVSRQHLTPTGTGTYSTHGKRGTKPTFGYP